MDGKIILGGKPPVPKPAPKSLTEIYEQGVLASQQLTESELLSAEQARKKEEQRLADLARRQQLAYQQGRQAISEQQFEQERALLQGAAARGLGGSGLQQLAQVQQRMASGRQISSLAQQEAMGTQNVSEQLSLAQQAEAAAISKAKAQQAGTEYKLAGELYAGETEAERYANTQAQQEQARITEEQRYNEAVQSQAFNGVLSLINDKRDPSVIKAALDDVKGRVSEEQYNSLVEASGISLVVGDLVESVYKSRWGSGNRTFVETKADGTKAVNKNVNTPGEAMDMIRSKYTGAEGFEQIAVMFDPNAFGLGVDYVFTTKDGQKFRNYKDALAYVTQSNPPAWTPEDLNQLKATIDQKVKQDSGTYSGSTFEGEGGGNIVDQTKRANAK